jgi:predicted nucleic acid-binding protein
MPNPKVFFDSSALIAGVISASGAARVLLVMSENGDIDLIISDQVITETERSLTRKAPHALPEYRDTMRDANIKVIRNRPCPKCRKTCI